MDYHAIMILAGILFLFFGLFILRDRITFIKNGIETYATVIRIEVLNDRENDSSYLPHFKVITDDEKVIIFEGGSGNYSKWTIGDQLKVFYNHSYPNDVIVGTFWGSYGKPVILLSAAFILLVPGIFHYL